MDEKQINEKPSKKFVLFGLVLGIISMLLGIFPLVTPWYSRTYSYDIDNGQKLKQDSTFHISYEYDVRSILKGEAVQDQTNSTIYYSGDEKKELCQNKNSTCTEILNFNKAFSFSISWVVLSAFLVGLSVLRILHIQSDLTSPLKWYSFYIIRFVILIMISLSVINIGILSFIFFSDTSDKIKTAYSVGKTNFSFDTSVGFGSLVFFFNSVICFVFFVQNLYEFKQNFDYCSERDKISEDSNEKKGLL